MPHVLDGAFPYLMAAVVLLLVCVLWKVDKVKLEYKELKVKMKFKGKGDAKHD